MRTSTRIVTVALASLAFVAVGCSSDNPASGGGDTSPAPVATDPATGETAAPAPAGNTGDWPPADKCTVL
ncbi:MAG: hypothetical protein ABMA25_21600, partial [Ilumatobacteraceae bacterium]